ncbi:hypothetical protein QR680_005556 [Steinernema hermaphroditum]|uniref:Peptidase M13 C-terminal domain-containing protein n=1 Tax=Steinernema hermaphroditum TaxID=289476 RepID=A0AA39HTR5_9BILA|nr:hypothetical protein QR680_005556 [Steinernema hermaphroditum]
MENSCTDRHSPQPVSTAHPYGGDADGEEVAKLFAAKMSRNSYAQWNGNGTMKSSLYDDYPCYAAPDFSSTLEKPPIPEHNVGFAASTDSSTVFKTGSTGRPSSNLYLPHRKRKTKTRKCFGTLTRFEFCLIVLSSLLLLSLLSVLLFWLIVLQGYPVLTKGVNFADVRRIHEGLPATSSFDQSAVHHDKVVCTSRECIRIAGFFAANLNDKVDPCDDFYEFACGNYELNKMLPANKPLRHTISDVQSRLHKQVKSVLEETPRDDDESWDRLAKNYYQKCLREDVLEETGAAAFRALLRRVGGWPVLEGTRWKEWEHGWEPQLALLFNRTGINAVVLEVAVSHHPSDSNLTIIELDQPKWGAGSRWPYLSGADDPMIVNYTQMMVETAVNLGADRKTAEADMREAVEFELKLVNFSADEMIRRDPERSNNAFNLDSLKQVFPYINFREYVDTLFAGIANVTNLDTVIVREVEYFRGIQHVLQSTPKRAIANYIGWRVVQGFSPFLPPKMRDPFYEFKANQTGMFNSPIPDRWEDCVTLSIIMLDMPVGKLFVEHFFDNSSMDKSAFINQLHKLEWMDAATKERAIEKAHFIQYKSGYPQTLFNATWMAENWGLMEGSKTEPLLDLSVRIKLARVREELLRLKQPQDRSLWFQSPAQVDAFYAPNLNEMIFPAGIMQFPFLTVGVPNYVTYAMVGAVVGHEVSHAFDDQGGRYDKLGNLHDWWDAETAQKFFEKVECFARQYGAVRVDEVGVHLNGRLSVGENIADNGGVKTAYAAYKSWLADTAASEPALPGFQNFTSDQLFFLAYANNWCSMVRPKHYVQLILTDVHAPAKYRAIIPLRNRPEFAAAFNCARGSRMNPEHKCQAW